MELYQLRVAQEAVELDSKINKLSAFLNSSQYQDLHANDQYILSRQLKAMIQYSDILHERIARFHEVNNGKA